MGLGIGFAKGILGIAFKPAIGVLDLASRATEGIRNSAFNETVYDASSHTLGRYRAPRTFGGSGEIIPFDKFAAAAQYLADKVTGFDRENRFLVTYYECIHRSLESVEESWGMSVGEVYLFLASVDRLILTRFRTPTDEMKASKTAESIGIQLLWSCPVGSVSQVGEDDKGDVILRLDCAVKTEGLWSDSHPVIHDALAKDYLVFQTLLERTVGARRARGQQLLPSDGLTEYDVLKKHSSFTISSMVKPPTKQVLILNGCVLYEYTVITRVPTEVTEEGREMSSVEINDNFTTKSAKLFISKFDYHFRKRDFAVLTYVYPLVNIASDGFTYEESGRIAIRINRSDGRNLEALRRTESKPYPLLCETECKHVVFTFRNQREALKWQVALKAASVSSSSDEDGLPGNGGGNVSYNRILQTFQRMKRNSSGRNLSGAFLTEGLAPNEDGDEADSSLNMIANLLIVPSAGNRSAATGIVERTKQFTVSSL